MPDRSVLMGSYVQALRRSVLVVAFTPDVSIRMNDILILRITIQMIRITVCYFSEVVGLFTTKATTTNTASASMPPPQ